MASFFGKPISAIPTKMLKMTTAGTTDLDGLFATQSYTVTVSAVGNPPIVVPSDWGSVEAPDESPVSLIGRYQQVYAADAFGPDPVEITAVAFRLNGPACTPYAQELFDLELLLATVPLNPDGLSPAFDDNLIVAGELLTVYSGSITLSSTCDGPPGGPMAFDIRVELQLPFTYQPAPGNNLLLQWTAFSGFPVGVGVMLDAVATLGDPVSTVISLDPVSPSGGLLTHGLITEFTTAGGGP